LAIYANRRAERLLEKMGLGWSWDWRRGLILSRATDTLHEKQIGEETKKTGGRRWLL